MQVDDGIFDMDEQLLSRSPERDEIMRTYRELSQESSRLRHRLSISPSPTSPTSLATSPCSRSASSRISYLYGESPVPTIPTISSTSPESSSLYEINQQIKATLTSLLNCESVKNDSTFRSWVQDKLMEAEHELKRQRRRRSGSERKEEAMRKLWEFEPKRRQTLKSDLL